jgi:hypothetical protein
MFYSFKFTISYWHCCFKYFNRPVVKKRLGSHGLIQRNDAKNIHWIPPHLFLANSYHVSIDPAVFSAIGRAIANLQIECIPTHFSPKYTPSFSMRAT